MDFLILLVVKIASISLHEENDYIRYEMILAVSEKEVFCSCACTQINR